MRFKIDENLPIDKRRSIVMFNFRMTAVASLLFPIAFLVCTSTPVKAASVVLVEKGSCQTAIFVAAETMDAKDHARLRDAVLDLAYYLGKMSGAAVPVYARVPNAEEKVIPILIGGLADAKFGPFTNKTDFRQSFRVVVSPQGVGLQGETDECISYAIYELLDELGCRWFTPGELGECIPRLASITLAERDATLSPSTASRNIWYADDAFRRRNRLGGFAYSAGHALEGYVTKEQLEQHPEWNAEIGGKRELHRCDVGHRLCWANPEVSAAVADTVIAMLDKEPAKTCISISPGDGFDFCECAKCKALDTGDWDVSMNCVSITDRYINFCNRIAERVVQKHPEAKLGFLAYVQFTRPPKREKLHPALIPQLAPISYCRAHTVNDPNCPSRATLREILQGWGKAAKNIAMYEYAYHLAEVAAPFPMIARNVEELPLQYANGVTMWTPETLPTFESGLPGLYLGIRMSWNSKADPKAILEEFYTAFYGAAGRAMKDYWQAIDDCWTKGPEHAGAGFGYMRRFTPERLAEARRLMDNAVSACGTAVEYRRVRLAETSLSQLERFMKMRRSYFQGDFAELESDSRRWTVLQQALAEEFSSNYAFAKTYWASQTVGVYFGSQFFFATYADASRIARDFKVLTPVLNRWHFAADREKKGETLGWQQPDFDDKPWSTTDVAMDTWAALNLCDYYGTVWYRGRMDVPAIPEGKKVFLWVGATDGNCKLFVNGRHVAYRNEKGEEKPEAEGYCTPFSFEITAAVKPGGSNQITIVGTRNSMNEFGTGGLLGPIVLYHEK